MARIGIRLRDADDPKRMEIAIRVNRGWCDTDGHYFPRELQEALETIYQTDPGAYELVFIPVCFNPFPLAA